MRRYIVFIYLVVDYNTGVADQPAVPSTAVASIHIITYTAGDGGGLRREPNWTNDDKTIDHRSRKSLRVYVNNDDDDDENDVSGPWGARRAHRRNSYRPDGRVYCCRSHIIPRTWCACVY